MNTNQKITIFKLFLTFATIAMVCTSVFGFAMYHKTSDGMQQQLIINTMFVNLFCSIFTGVTTLVLALTDASRDESTGELSK